MTAGLYIRQLASSLPSLQSGSPSHRHFLWIQSPEWHCISLDEHFAGGVGWWPQREGDSSDWSCRTKTKIRSDSVKQTLVLMEIWGQLLIKLISWKKKNHFKRFFPLFQFVTISQNFFSLLHLLFFHCHFLSFTRSLRLKQKLWNTSLSHSQLQLII